MAEKKPLSEIAARFRTLPFAFLEQPEIEQLAQQIEQGNIDRAIERLDEDIEVHQCCDNWIKADYEKEVRNWLNHHNEYSRIDPEASYG
jgi:hypothetical protein